MKILKLFLVIVLWSAIILPSFSFGKVNFTNSVFDNSQKMLILTSDDNVSKLKVEKFELKEPSRVIFDIKNAVLEDVKSKVMPEGSDITSVKVAQFSTRPNVVRVVFTGEDEALDAIRVLTLKNIVIFDIEDFNRVPPKSYVYKDDEPSLKEADYFCYYEKLNVTLSSQLKAQKAKAAKKKTSAAKKAPPSEKLDDEKWNEIKILEFPAKYTINKVSKLESGDGIKISGIGKMSMKSPFTLKTPSRLVVDFPNAALEKKEFLESIKLGEGEQIRFGKFDDKTVRMVIETPKPKDFNIIVSPDMRTVFVQKNKNLDALEIPFLQKATLEKFEAKQVDKQTTKLTIKSSSPIAHTIRKDDDGVLLGLLNLNTTADFLNEVISTKQFKTAHLIPIQNNFNGTYWKLPLKTSSRITTELSADGKELVVFIKDKIFPYKNIVIKSGATVLLDPGHGGKDGGACRGGVYEKRLVLDLAKSLRTYLKSHGVRVYMTRYSDTTVSLSSRVYKSRKIRPDLYVSLHVNSSKKPQIKGVETHWYGYQGRKLAQIIHNNMALGINTADRGMFRSKFYVIRRTRVPAVLVETGFISNKQERRSLLTNQRKENTVKSIGNGILLYLAMKYENPQKLKPKTYKKKTYRKKTYRKKTYKKKTYKKKTYKKKTTYSKKSYKKASYKKKTYKKKK